MSTTRDPAKRGTGTGVAGLEVTVTTVAPPAVLPDATGAAGRPVAGLTEPERARGLLASASCESVLLAALAAEAAALVDAAASVSTLGPGGGLTRRVAVGDPADPPGAVDQRSTPCGRVVATGAAVLGDLPGDCGPGDGCCPRARSHLAVPLLAPDGVVLGLLTLTCTQPHWFADVDLATASDLADVAGHRLADLRAAASRGAALRADAPGDRRPAAPPTRRAPGELAGRSPATANPTAANPTAAGPAPAAPAAPVAPAAGDAGGAGGAGGAAAVGPVAVRIPEARSAPPAPASPTPIALTPTSSTAAPPTTATTPAALGLGLWEWDRDSDQVLLSPQVQELTRRAGYERPGLAALRAMLHPGDRGRFDEALRRLVETGSGWNGTARVVLPDGSTRQVYAWADVRRRDGMVTGAWGAVVDVTQRERDAAALQTSLLGLRAAQELTGLGTWEWHPDDDTLVWSAEMFRLVGLEPAEIRPTLAHWHDFVHPDDVARAQRLDVLAAGLDGARGARGGGRVETFRIIGADGVLRHVQSWSSLVDAEATGRRIVCGATVDVTRQVRDRVMLERMSATDTVTGLGNRHAFDQRMRELLGEPGGDVSLLLLDLDRFKLVNDSLGHQVGDRLLVQVARRLSAVVPAGSTTARMGGDEFVVVPQPGLDWLQVRRLAQSIVDELRMPYVLPDSGEVLVCPASVGVTSSVGRRTTADELLLEADLALYRAKDSGRDRYVVFDDHLRARARSRHRAERLLRRALENDGLVLQYQPIVDFANGHVVGAEALVRIRASATGNATGRATTFGAHGGEEELIPPDVFIEVAEDTGLVVELDCWVIDTALAQAAAWISRCGVAATPWLAINVSARSMEHPRVVRRLLDGVQRAGIPADRLKIELTEHSFLGTLPAGETALRQLLASGIPVGIDDFGTGYSALAYLQRFDLDFMKIDKSFVAGVGQQDRADAVVTAIVDLAHAHGMRVTAEGVETPQQARRLREIGCDLAQGFHFGRPGDATRILRG